MVKDVNGLGIPPIADIATGAVKEGASGGKSFGEFLTESLNKVNQLQQESEAAVKSIAEGSDATSLQDAMIAVEKADVAFKLMMEVRQKILDAYKEITTMQA